MRGIFDDPELEPARPRRDTELTLGNGILFGIFAGLVLLCVLCFGLGYVVGHRVPHAPPAAAATQPVASASAEPALQAASSAPKPSATGQNGAVRQSATDGQGGDGAAAQPSGTDAGANAQRAEPAAGDGAAAGQSQVSPGQGKPVLPAAAKPSQPAQPAMELGGSSRIQPGMNSAGASAGAPALALMVQIAAVSHVEDATVLVNALRKRGYEVTARREPADGLIHVRIGPFSSGDEAEKWRLKLLNDGYNALVQP